LRTPKKEKERKEVGIGQREGMESKVARNQRLWEPKIPRKERS
jgi:hypothetical protein